MRYNYLEFSLYQIQIFLEACEQKSFTATAQRMQTTQSSISKNIAAMEGILGFPLFVREKNRLRLTPAAELLYVEWKNIVSGVELSIDKAHVLAKQGTNSFVIGEPDSLRNYEDYMPSILAFQQENPDVNLFYRQEPVGYLIPLLVAKEIDLLFTIAYDIPMLKNLDLKWVKISKRPLTISVHVNHPLSQREKLGFEDLKDEEFYVLSPAKHPNYMAQLTELCARHGYTPKIGYCAPNPRSAIISIIRTGKGVLFTDSIVFDDKSPEIKHFELDSPDSGIVMAWRDNPDKPELQRLIDKILKDKGM